MVEMRGLFGNLNNTLNNLPLSGNLGLLTTGVSLLEGQPIGQAVRSGLQTYQGLSSIDEERKRREAMANLADEYKNDPRLMQILKANPEAGLSLIARLEAEKRKPKDAFKILTAEEVKTLGAAPGTIIQRNTTTGDLDVLAKGTVSKPVLREIGGSLFDVSDTNNPKVIIQGKGDLRTVGNQVIDFSDPQNPQVIFQGEDEPVLKTLNGDLYDVSDVSNPKLVVEVPKAAVLKVFENNLVDVSDPQNPKIVMEGKKDTKFISSGGAIFRQDGENLVEVVSKATEPKSANLINLLATKDFNLNGQLIKKGEVFTLDKNNQAELINKATDLQTGGAIIAPSKVENITGGADTGDQPPAISPVSPIDIKQAAGGDIAGFAKDFFNIVGGITMFGEPATARRDERSNLAALENAVLPGLVRSISSTGAVKTQEAAKALIPSPLDNDNKMSSKVNALIPVLQQKLQEADNVLKLPSKITASQRTLATQITSTYPQIISALQISKDRYEKKNTKSDVQKKADKILEELK